VSGQDRSTPKRPRILVLPGGSGSGRIDLEREAVYFLVKRLVDMGYLVVNPGQIPPKKGPAAAHRRPDFTDRADILVRVRLDALRERRQQGRYRIEDRLWVRMVRLKDASVLLETSLTGKGTSFYSYRKAHFDALRDLCATSTDALVAANKRKRTAQAMKNRRIPGILPQSPPR